MATDAHKEFVGTWRLVHSVEFMEDGRTRYPFGQDAVGYIVYSQSGVMAVQIARKTRSRDHSEKLVGPADYLAYFGRYEIDTDNELVRHLLEGQVFPGHHPEILERKYRFFDDKLSLKPLDGTDREILWQRTANQ
jgi:Lipocalin-like domain